MIYVVSPLLNTLSCVNLVDKLGCVNFSAFNASATGTRSQYNIAPVCYVIYSFLRLYYLSYRPFFL